MIDHPQPASDPRRLADAPSAAQRHWRWTVRLSLALMGVWTAVTFGVGFFARELTFLWFGWPFSFWVGAQGALLVYLALVAFYAWAMRRLDRACGFEEP